MGHASRGLANVAGVCYEKGAMEYYEYYDYKTTVPRMLGLTMTRVERGNDSNSDTLTFEAENGLTFVQDLFTFLHGEVTEFFDLVLQEQIRRQKEVSS